MSTLTKVFIVVLFVAAVFASPVMIQHVVHSSKYKELYETEKGQRELAEEQSRLDKQETGAKNKSLDALQDIHQAYVQKHQEDMEEKRAEIARIGQNLVSTQGDLKNLQASLAALEKDLNKEIELRKVLKRELDRARSEGIKLAEQVRDFTDTTKEQQATIERMNASLYVVQEQEAQARAEIRDLRERLSRAQVGGVAVDGAPVRPRGPKIAGTVTAVKANIAALNVGSADGVKEGDEFIIYRGGDFVANLRIADVYASNSAGIILKAQRDVRKGDKATTSLD